MRRNLESKFTYNGVKTTYASYSIQDLINMKKEKYIRNQNLKEEDIKSMDFDRTLRSAIIKNYHSMLSALENAEPYDLEIPYKGMTLRIYKRDLSEWLRRQTKFINNHSKRYKKDLLEEIKRTAVHYEIDKDNYAVDLSKKRFLNKKDKVKHLHPTDKIKKEAYKVKEDSRIGIIDYKAMSMEEILESRKKLGI